MVKIKTQNSSLETLYMTGSSHAIRLMRGDEDVAVVGIRGGGCGHVKQRVQSYTPLQRGSITDVVVVAGGNDLDRRISRAAEFKTATKTTETELTSLALFLSESFPRANIVTFDILPRSSEGSIFNSRARRIALNVRQANERHHHINFIKSFTVRNRRGHKNDLRAEEYPVVSAFYKGGDGTHLNAAGYQAVRKIADWALSGEKEIGNMYDSEENGWRVHAVFKF